MRNVFGCLLLFLGGLAFVGGLFFGASYLIAHENIARNLDHIENSDTTGPQDCRPKTLNSWTPVEGTLYYPPSVDGEMEIQMAEDGLSAKAYWNGKELDLLAPLSLCEGYIFQYKTYHVLVLLNNQHLYFKKVEKGE
jgi:hypothetical protein